MDFLGSRQEDIKRSLSCPICQKPFRKVTVVEACWHRFCHDCITKKITEEGLHSCPICNVDLGSAPLQKLRVDHRWQSMMDNLSNEGKRENTESGLVKYVADGGLFTEQHVRKRSAEEREKPPAKTGGRSLTGNDHHRNANIFTKGVVIKSAAAEDVKVTSMMQRSGEILRPKPREEQVSIGVSKNNETAVAAREDKNVVKNNEKQKTFWFSLVASDKQGSKAPLEQIPARYLRVKDGSITVSSIKKYLMHKLNLRSENEVEISLQGRRLLPSLQISRLIELWLQTISTSERKTTFVVGSSAKDFVLPLTYARNPSFSA